MKLTLKRIFLGETYTIGKLYIDGVYRCDTLEDKVIDTDKSGRFEGNEKKVYGETAIPYGTYEVIITLSPRFRRWLPELKNVPHFESIRIHSGNTVEDTHGCILVGQNKIKGQVVNSRMTEIELMKVLKGQRDITIEIV